MSGHLHSGQYSCFWTSVSVHLNLFLHWTSLCGFPIPLCLTLVEVKEIIIKSLSLFSVYKDNIVPSFGVTIMLSIIMSPHSREKMLSPCLQIWRNHCSDGFLYTADVCTKSSHSCSHKTYIPVTHKETTMWMQPSDHMCLYMSVCACARVSVCLKDRNSCHLNKPFPSWSLQSYTRFRDAKA